MMRTLIRGLGATFLALASLYVAVEPAHAAPKKKTDKQVQQAVPQSAEIGKAMGDLKWGTPRDTVLATFTNSIKERYRPEIAKATGAIEEDKLRARMREELARLKDGMVEFNGKKTGWDVSFLKGEFTHHNNESLFVVKDENSQNYYFFIHGKLWKWFKAFDAATFQGKTFAQFAEAIQGRYGKGQGRQGELTAGSGKQRWLEWQDAETRLRAVDNTQFYGFYCLVFEHKDTVRRLPELRATAPRTEPDKNAMVESVTNEVEGEASADNNQDVIDRITGKIRRRQDAPEATGEAAPRPAAQSPQTGHAKSDSDPLEGL